MLVTVTAIIVTMVFLAASTVHLRKAGASLSNKLYPIALLFANIGGIGYVAVSSFMGANAPVTLLLLSALTMSASVCVIMATTTPMWRGNAVDQFIRANAVTIILTSSCLFYFSPGVSTQQSIAIFTGMVGTYGGLLMRRMAAVRQDITPGVVGGLRGYATSLIALSHTVVLLYFIPHPALPVLHQTLCTISGVYMAYYFYQRSRRVNVFPGPVPPRPRPNFTNYILVCIATAITLPALIAHPSMQHPIVFIIVATCVISVVVRQVFTLMEYESLQQAVEAREYTYRTLVQNSTDVITLCDPAILTATYVSPAAARVLGTTSDTLQGQHVHHILGLNQEEATRLLEGLPVGQDSSSIEGRRGERHVESFAHRQEGQIVITTRNTSEREALRAQLRDLAYFDPLTGLFNRNHFDEVLVKWLDDSPEHTALMFIDLDRFKHVNDTAGHDAGDEVLRVIGSRLLSVIGPGSIVSRYGGDEFVVLVNTSTDDPTSVAYRCVAEMGTPIETRWGSFDVGCSIGIAYAEQGTTRTELLRHADTAMYTAKHSDLDVVEHDKNMKTSELPHDTKGVKK